MLRASRFRRSSTTPCSAMMFTVMNTVVKVVSRAQTNRLTLPLRPQASLFQAQDSLLRMRRIRVLTGDQRESESPGSFRAAVEAANADAAITSIRFRRDLGTIKLPEHRHLHWYSGVGHRRRGNGRRLR